MVINQSCYIDPTENKSYETQKGEKINNYSWNIH